MSSIVKEKQGRRFPAQQSNDLASLRERDRKTKKSFNTALIFCTYQKAFCQKPFLHSHRLINFTESLLLRSSAHTKKPFVQKPFPHNFGLFLTSRHLSLCGLRHIPRSLVPKSLFCTFSAFFTSQHVSICGALHTTLCHAYQQKYVQALRPCCVEPSFDR